MRRFYHRVGDALSQLGNTIFYGGEANHSICGDAWFKRRRRSERFWNWVFAWLEPDHCRAAHYRDIDRMAERLVEHLERYPEDAIRFEKLRSML